MDAETSPRPIAERTALVVAHPGHELAILGWLERAAPEVFVLTDGGGREGRSRIAATAEILELVGGRPGAIFGRLSEPRVYEALLAGDTALFVALAEELAQALTRGRFGAVVADAAEGFQPTHDVFRLVVDAAVELAGRAGGERLGSYEFTLFGRQSECPEELRDKAVWISLDDAGLARKLAISGNYRELTAEFRAAMTGDMAAVLGAFPELAALAKDLIGELGPEAYRVECLRPVDPIRASAPPPPMPRPFYELYGEALARAGRVSHVIRRDEHLLPVAAALRRRLALAAGEGL